MACASQSGSCAKPGAQRIVIVLTNEAARSQDSGLCFARSLNPSVARTVSLAARPFEVLRRGRGRPDESGNGGNAQGPLNLSPLDGTEVRLERGVHEQHRTTRESANEVVPHRSMEETCPVATGVRADHDDPAVRRSRRADDPRPDVAVRHSFKMEARDHQFRWSDRTSAPDQDDRRLGVVLTVHGLARPRHRGRKNRIPRLSSTRINSTAPPVPAVSARAYSSAASENSVSSIVTATRASGSRSAGPERGFELSAGLVAGHASPTYQQLKSVAYFGNMRPSAC